MADLQGFSPYPGFRVPLLLRPRLSRPGTAIHRPAPIRTQAGTGVKAEVEVTIGFGGGLACCAIRPDHPIHSPCRIRLERRRAGKAGTSSTRTSSGRTSRCRAPPGGFSVMGSAAPRPDDEAHLRLGWTKPLAAGGQASLIVVSVPTGPGPGQPFRLSTQCWLCPARGGGTGLARRGDFDERGAWRPRLRRIAPGTADDHRHRSPVRGFRFADNTRGP